MSDIDAAAAAPVEAEEAELSEQSRDRYYCRACRALITTGEERAEVDGGHVHTFVNPSGFIFRIGCFRSAPGCRTFGESTSAFTWFAGRAWTLAACARCSSHLGWAYDNRGAREFFGLILDQLLRGEGD